MDIEEADDHLGIDIGITLATWAVHESEET